MIASTIYLSNDIIKANVLSGSATSYLELLTIVATFALLQFTKLPAPVIALACLLAGFF